MRPSPRLVVIALTLAALSTLMVLLARDAASMLLVLWAGLAAAGMADLFLSVPRRDLSVEVQVPATGYTGGSLRLTVDLALRWGALPPGLTAVLDLPPALGPGDLPDPVPVDAARARIAAHLPLMRRGTHRIRTLSLKWLSRLGLFELIADIALDRDVTVVPDIAPILSGQIATRMLPLTEGLKDMQLRGEGSEFHQLREFQPGMDPRSIDWKRSARAQPCRPRNPRGTQPPDHALPRCRVSDGRTDRRPAQAGPRDERGPCDGLGGEPRR